MSLVKSKVRIIGITFNSEKKFQWNNLRSNILDVSFVLFVISLLYQFTVQLFSHYCYDSWNISEFLINYQGGFIRRGLIGEILLFFYKRFNIDVILAIKILCLSSFCAVCFCFIKLFLKKKYPLHILPMFFFLGGSIIADFWIRKDFLLILIFILIIWLFKKTKIPFVLKGMFINILTIIAILSHELSFFFYIPILCILYFNHFKNKGILKSVYVSFVTLLPSLIVFLMVIYFHGSPETPQLIRDSWTCATWDPTKGFIFGNVYVYDAIQGIALYADHAILFHLTVNFMWFDNMIYSLIVWIITFPLIYYISSNYLPLFTDKDTIGAFEKKNGISYILFFQFIWLLPVFILLSCDYMRIVFYWITSSYAIFLLFDDNSIKMIFPKFFVKTVDKVNYVMNKILIPTKASFVFLMCFMGMSQYFFCIEQLYKSTMIYNILFIVSKPFALLFRFIL